MDERAIRGVPWTLLTFGATRVASVLTTIVLARLLVPADFGLFTLSLLGTGVLGVLSGIWLSSTLILHEELDDRVAGTVLTLVLLAGAVAAALLVALSPLAAELFGQPRLTETLPVLSMILLFSGVNWFYETILQRELRFRRRFCTQVARTVTFSVVGLILAVHGAGVWSLVLAHVAGYAASGVALLVLTPYRVRPAFDGRIAKEVVRAGFGFLLQDAATYLQENGDYIAVGKVLGPAQLGFYSMAYRQAELPTYAIAEPVTKVTFPAFTQMRQRGEDVGPVFLKGLRLIALATAPLAVVLSAGAEPFVLTVFGDPCLPMAGPLAVLGIWALLRPLELYMGRVLNSFNRAGVFGRISLIVLTPLFFAVLAAAKFGGITAVAWVVLVHMASVSVLLMWVIRRHTGFKVRSQLTALSPVFAAASVAWLATRATVRLLEDAPAAVALGASVAVCLSAYLIATRVAAPGLLSEAVRLIRRSLGRSPTPAASA